MWSLFCQQSQILTLTSPVDINVLTGSALVLTTNDSLFHSFQIRITKTMFVNSLLYRQLRRLPEILILDWFSSLEFAFKSIPFFNSMARIPVIVPFMVLYPSNIFKKLKINIEIDTGLSFSPNVSSSRILSSLCGMPACERTAYIMKG